MLTKLGEDGHRPRSGGVVDPFPLCFNAHEGTGEFAVPGKDYAPEWTVELDTAEPASRAEQAVRPGGAMRVSGRSLLVLRKVR